MVFFVPIAFRWNVFFHQIMCLESYTLFCRLFLFFLLGNWPFHWVLLCYLRTGEINPSSVTERMTCDSRALQGTGVDSADRCSLCLWANESGGWGWVRQWAAISLVFPSHLNLCTRMKDMCMSNCFLNYSNSGCSSYHKSYNTCVN